MWSKVKHTIIALIRKTENNEPTKKRTLFGFVFYVDITFCINSFISLLTIVNLSTISLNSVTNKACSEDDPFIWPILSSNVCILEEIPCFVFYVDITFCINSFISLLTVVNLSTISLNSVTSWACSEDDPFIWPILSSNVCILEEILAMSFLYFPLHVRFRLRAFEPRSLPH